MMSEKHLSELCSESEVEPIYARLKQLAPESVETNAAGLEEDAELEQYVSGVWGYRDADGRTALHWAVALRNYDLATTLMNAPYNSPVLTEDSEGLTPFSTACMIGAPEPFVRDLLDRSVAVHDVFKKWQAVYGTGSAETSEAGPSAEVPAAVSPTLSIVDAEDSLGNTPLLMTVGRGQLQLVRLLLSLGANLEHQNHRGQSVLHRAVSRGNLDLVEELVRASEQRHAQSKPAHRRWMNLQDRRGDTALFYASMENNEDVGRYLIRHGTDKELRNKDGKQFWEV